jgi:phytoene dehydrogenase-like protein
MKDFYVNTKINPKGLKKDEYDVIIVGAGIGGLVCGCYLAKAGMKVLIVEKNNKPGGYCTSFDKDGFKFDVCAHGLGGMRKNGNLRKIIAELKLDLNIIRFDPSDIIATPDYEVCFWNDLNKTIYDFQSKFPEEAKQIELFFNFISETHPLLLFYKLRQRTFKQLLDEYFRNEKLKTILGFPLGNLGVSSKIASALKSVILYKEFMLNGGYYPLGGMQTLPDSLVKKFREFGGETIFSTKVKKIGIKNILASSIITDDNKYFKLNYVVSACDMKQTYFELLGRRYFSKTSIKKIEQATISPSAFIVYIGFNDKPGTDSLNKGGALWYTSSYNIDNIFLHSRNPDDIDYQYNGFFCSLAYPDITNFNSNKRGVYLLRIAPFKNEKFWEKYKYKTVDILLSQFKKAFLTKIKSEGIIKGISTPYDFFTYTLNQKGSAYGLAATIWNHNLRIVKSIRNISMVGHWNTNILESGGINSVAFMGYKESQKIIKKWTT